MFFSIGDTEDKKNSYFTLFVMYSIIRAKATEKRFSLEKRNAIKRNKQEDNTISVK